MVQRRRLFIPISPELESILRIARHDQLCGEGPYQLELPEALDEVPFRQVAEVVLCGDACLQPTAECRPGCEKFDLLGREYAAHQCQDAGEPNGKRLRLWFDHIESPDGPWRRHGLLSGFTDQSVSVEHGRHAAHSSVAGSICLPITTARKAGAGLPRPAESYSSSRFFKRPMCHKRSRICIA